MGDKAYTPDLWKQYLEESLEALGVDRIDFYHAHVLTWDKFTGAFQEPGGPLELCHQARDEGIIDHLCFSSHDTPENIIKMIDSGLFDGIIVQYNLLDRQQQFGRHTAGAGNEPAIARAAERGMGVLIMGTVAGGRLVAPESEQLQRLLTGSTKSIPDLAIRYVLSNPAVTSAMSGMNTIEMVEENVASASHERPMTEQEYEQIREITGRYEKLGELYCTGCGYCQPCPQEINIPRAFEAMNYHRVWGLTEHAKQMYQRLEPNAEACVECGQCEENCPQDLPIIEQLKETHAALGE
jgi:predicted aldo/keto reductase-like oxidoreductase